MIGIRSLLSRGTRAPAPPTLVYIITVPLSARYLLQGQLRYMKDQGFHVVVVSSPGSDLQLVADRENVVTFSVPMRREISPLHDLVVLFRLYVLLRRLKPVIVNAGTPKAGLLGMCAAWLARVPVRVYVVRGLRLETLTGWRRYVSIASERVAAASAHRVICVSESLRQVFIAMGLAPQTKTLVLASGSSNGVNAEHFSPGQENRSQSLALRRTLGIPEDAPVIGFVGRLTRDKGVLELLDAFDEVRRTVPTARLLLLGRFEDGSPIPDSYVQRLKAHTHVILTGWVSDAAPYYHIMDILAFPTYREGFPNVPIQAASAGLPVVGFRATGTIDAVQDGVTGMLVPIGDTAALARAMLAYLGDRELREKHGTAGRARVVKDFRQETIWAALCTEYIRFLRARGLPLPEPAQTRQYAEQVPREGVVSSRPGVRALKDRP